MKKFLLSFCFISTILCLKAQTPLPLIEDFESGAPDGWNGLTQGLSIERYSVNTGSGCRPESRGVFVPYSESNNANSNVRALTPSLGFVNTGQIVTTQFEFYAFNSNVLRSCANQITSSCNATIRVYLVNSNYNSPAVPPANMVYGQSASVQVSTTNNGTPLGVSVPISAPIPPNSSFKVFLHVLSFGSCAGVQGFIVDNLFINAAEQAPLPVSFKSFTAERKGSEVTLNWTTASEQNNKGFFIERNVNGEWKNAGFVASKANSGNSSSDLLYTFSHTNNAKGISEYRLMQVDIDGKAKYSEIRSVRGEGAASRIVVYPNPSSSGAVTVMFNDLQAKDVQVTDISGRVLSRYNNVINNIEIKNLKAGMYTISVSDRQSGVKSILKAIVQ